MARKRRYGDEPQLPPETELKRRSSFALDDGQGGVGLLLADLDLSGQEAQDLLLEQSLLQRVDMSRSQLRLSQLVDVRFEQCELSNADWEKLHLTRAAFGHSRLTGLRLVEARLDGAQLRQCQAELAIFWSASLRNVRFEGCRLQEASFEGATLENVVFQGCDLSQVDLRGATLQGVDLRGSKLSGMQLGSLEGGAIPRLDGLTIDPEQALELVTLLGVVVKPVDGR